MTKRARKACELKMGDIVVGSVVVGSIVIGSGSISSGFLVREALGNYWMDGSLGGSPFADSLCKRTIYALAYLHTLTIIKHQFSIFQLLKFTEVSVGVTISHKIYWPDLALILKFDIWCWLLTFGIWPLIFSIIDYKAQHCLNITDEFWRYLSNLKPSASASSNQTFAFFKLQSYQFKN